MHRHTPHPSRPAARTSAARHAPLAALAAAVIALGTLAPAPPARAFCGFFVATGDSKLFNKSSSVAIVRDGDRTVLTMASDFKGDPREFAMVVPVPTVLQRGQIHVGEQA